MPRVSEDTARLLYESASGQSNRLQEIGARAPRRLGTPPIDEAEGLWEHLQAGAQMSTGGLITRQERPEIILEQNPDMAERLAYQAAMVVGDLPTIIGGGLAGGAAGGPAAVVTAPAGAFALTEGTRQFLLDQFDEGVDKKTVAERITATAWATTKGAVIGGATGGAGGIVASAPFKSALNKAVNVTAAELATMVTTASALEGHLPTKEDFITGAILLGGLKAGVGTAGKLRSIYQKTGKKPNQVVKDAAKDPMLRQELTDPQAPGIPLRYRADMRPESGPRIQPPEQIKARPIANAVKEEFSKHVSRKPTGEEVLGRLDRWTSKAELNETVSYLKRDMHLRLQAQRSGGVKSWDHSAKEAESWIRDTFGYEALPPTRLRLSNPRQWDVEVMTRAELLGKQTEFYQNRVINLAEKVKTGKELSTQELGDLLAAQQRAKIVYNELDTATTGAGRALNISKKAKEKKVAQAQADVQLLKELHTKHGTKTEAKLLEKIEQEFGGTEAAKMYVEWLAKARDAKYVVNSLKAKTPFDKALWAWKSMLLSGTGTQQINFLSTAAFTYGFRSLETIPTAMWSKALGTKGGATFADSLGLWMGHAVGAKTQMQAAYNATKMSAQQHGILKGLWEAHKKIDLPERLRTDLPHYGSRPPIDNILGDILNLPYKGLQAGDSWFRVGNYYASLYEQAVRQTVHAKKARVGSKKFMAEVRRRAESPTKDMMIEAERMSKKFTFMEEGGKVVQAMQAVRDHIPFAHMIPFPFLQTPGAVFREGFRRTPLAPAVKQWRQDVRAGGVRRDAALAEAATGTAIMTGLFMAAREGVITGTGHPDPEQREADYAAGWKPGSVWIPNQGYVAVDRLEPLGVLMVLSANTEQWWSMMNEGEQEDASAALFMAASEVVSNKTWLRSMTSFLNAIGQPDRYAENWAEDFFGTAVPNLVGEQARRMDPYVREVDGIIDGIKAKIPKWRETLRVMRDDYGQPIERDPGIYPGSPLTVSEPVQDRVRLEGQRLGVSSGDVPKELSAGTIMGESAMFDLTEDQLDDYAQYAGQVAYKILNKQVNSPAWERIPDPLKRAAYEDAFRTGRSFARIRIKNPRQELGAMKMLREELMQ